MAKKIIGLLIRFNGNEGEELDGHQTVFASNDGDKVSVERMMSEHHQEPVKILFIDEIDNRDNYDTIITIGAKNYYAFTRWVDINL